MIWFHDVPVVGDVINDYNSVKTTPQTLTAVEKDQVQMNIGLYETVKYEEQTLTEQQREQARSNIGVGNFITDESSFKQAILNFIFPVGFTCIFWNDVDPNVQYGGQWIKIEDKFLVGKGSDFTTKGGHKIVTLYHDNIPSHRHTISHTHTAGDMKIDGYIDAQAYSRGNTSSGAFEPARYGNVDSGTSQYADYVNRVHLRADKDHGWTGKTSSPSSGWSGYTGGDAFGETVPFEIIPPYEAVSVWKRIA